MQMQEFTALMSELRAHYQNPVRDEDLWLASISQYWHEMQRCPDDQMRKAFSVAWRKHPEWMPSCGQLMDLIESDGGSTKLLAAEAWIKAMELAKRSSADHPDPIAKAVMRMMGGGPAFGKMTDQDRPFRKQEFCSLYEEQHAKAPPMMLNGPTAVGLLT